MIEAEINELLGKTIIEITGLEKDSDEVRIWCDDGTRYKMYHEQDCCEEVYIEDVAGDVSALVGSPITLAEDISNQLEDREPVDLEEWSWTWTFYKLATIKGYVTIRWYGASNGYYSEEVDFVELEGEEDES